MADDHESERNAESRRILKRVSQEAENGGSALGRAARRARDHVSAADVDRDDWAEYWGTRIGRTLGALLLVGLIVWLVLYLAQGS